MSKIFSFNEGLNGSYIDSVSEVAGTNTNGVFKRTEKGLAWTATGVSEGIEITMPILSRNSATIFAWVKLRGDDSQFILGNSTQHTFQYWGLRGANDLNCECDINGQYWSLATDFSANFNKWTHVMLVADSGTVTTYWNNIAVDTETPTADITFNLIGKGGIAYWLNGSIAKIAMYDHIFTEKERAKSYTEFLQATPVAIEKYPSYNPFSKPSDLSSVSDLIAAYNMIPSTGGVLVDVSDNDGNGVITGPISTLDGLRFDGVDDTVRLYIEAGIAVTVKTICFRIKLDTTTEEILEGGTGTELIYAAAGTLVYADYSTAYINGIETDTVVANQWMNIVITSETPVSNATATLGLNVIV